MSSSGKRKTPIASRFTAGKYPRDGFADIGKDDAEAIVQRGKQAYASELAPHLEGTLFGSVVAIDVTSGAYAIGPTVSAAVRVVRESHPDGLFYSTRIGSNVLGHLGMGSSSRD